MRSVIFAICLIMACHSAAGSDVRLYERLATTELTRDKFTSKRTAAGIDFLSKETIAAGKAHPRFHLEIEGPLPVDGITTLKAAVEKVATVIAPEVDSAHPEKNTISAGLAVDIVDVNGVEVAFLQYKSSRETDTFLRRAILYTAGNIYTVTMTLHGVPENDRMGMLVPALVIEMVNSHEIPGLLPK